MRIRHIFSDIDGVLTDGRVQIDASGQERKSICYRDLDAIGIGRRNGLEFTFVTGEDTELARYIAKRFGVRAVYGAKDKEIAVAALLSEYGLHAEETCYLGDSYRDAPALRMCGLGAVPCDASASASRAADWVLASRGGSGVLLELVERILEDAHET